MKQLYCKNRENINSQFTAPCMHTFHVHLDSITWNDVNMMLQHVKSIHLHLLGFMFFKEWV